MTEPTTAAPQTKTYTLLSDIPKVKTENCSEMLPNHMQCWRAGDYLVTVPGPVEIDAETGKVTQQVQQYQKCRRHAALEQEQDIVKANAEQAKANDEAQKPETKPKIS